MRQAIDAVGVDRILFSTDYPYQYRPGGDARRFVEDLELDAADKAKFAHANWSASPQAACSPDLGRMLPFVRQTHKVLQFAAGNPFRCVTHLLT
ncbi:MULTISPECIES: amidohydrolase [unclassified Rhizobium]|uniref:amidohydrolase n=1 Tax=unclassified Rhizobium TaxID=2613769 RepID=UPI0021F6AD25|nr:MULTISPECIES: amidohydrolase [unclassified Rhizobium]MCV9942827.1 amidohydrolase [Rhizobium sp. BT-175]MCW0015213.1 amidohydrolase [Rhizobium sp. BT-226]